MHSFPHADIHRLLASDLLHQLIKGTFNDYLVTWVGEYLHKIYGEKQSLEIIEDINHRISAWTEDDSKVLMKASVCCCYCWISPVLECLQSCVARFHELQDIFITSEVHATISSSHQHALLHYLYSIPYFASSNGTCSSITESKQIKAALSQMLHMIMCMEKIALIKHIFKQKGMMVGTTASYTATHLCGSDPEGNSSVWFA
ncbi:hypothetical protein BDN70DRAFT_906459 [Pholiota conissans]|uniref:Uncharacterized protein n=1 Tax=Pholiota conissans TaxID=109636 RepID=A0A9P5Z331_9AGAR|nr:hypothetical protein BDN70DRAFT_906459 [Pholiota conissans]